MSDPSAITATQVAFAVSAHLPGRAVVATEDRGTWIRRIFRVTLDGGELVYVKVDAGIKASVKEAYVTGLLHDHGLPAPDILAVDDTGTLLAAPFVIQAHVGGTRLGDLLARKPDVATRAAIYAAVGDFYRRIHAIHREAPGWIDGPGIVFPGSPRAHQYQAVIVEYGAEAVAQGLISPEAHRRMQALWDANRDYLDTYVPPLTTGGAHPWSVYLASEGGWHVTKIMDLHDLAYWDPAWNLTSVKYPEFMEDPDPTAWAAFVDAYGDEPEEKRLRLYLLMRRIDAGMGHYLAPPMPANEAWRAGVWSTFDALLDDVETLCA